MDFLSSMYVTLDPQLAEWIGLAATAIVSFLILQVANTLPWLGEYLGQHRVGITVWLTGILVQLTQSYLDRIPETFDSIVVLVMQLIVQVVAVIVAFALYRRAQIKGYRAL
jgi:putative flippase GtrA